MFSFCTIRLPFSHVKHFFERVQKFLDLRFLELEWLRKADLVPFDLAEIAHQAYDPTHFQPVLSCADSGDAMHSRCAVFSVVGSVAATLYSIEL